jgi:hypothetical protein
VTAPGVVHVRDEIPVEPQEMLDRGAEAHRDRFQRLARSDVVLVREPVLVPNLDTPLGRQRNGGPVRAISRINSIA